MSLSLQDKTNRFRTILLSAVIYAVFIVSPGFAQPEPFDTAPVWESGLANLTRSVAVGDVNGDGYLDLICGNMAASNTLYLGIRGFFESGPVWSSYFANFTLSVALGDIDGDGDPDLVCGNAGVNTIYENVDWRLGRWVSWSSDSSYTSTSVALGDVNGDGGLDLVFGNTGGKNTLYLNTGNGFNSSPDWSSDAQNETWSVVLGDIYDDGDLDLVCGNLEQPDVLHINNGGMLETSPAWSSASAFATTILVLGDVNGDGGLDLVCGNFDQPNVLYLNLGGTFPANPSWTSSVSDSTLGLSLGDVDRDGDLDLVCGNERQANTLHLNTGSSLETIPSWYSARTSGTVGVTLADANGDGKLDLICANSNQTNTVYLNQSNPFESSPVWSSGPANSTLSLARGDVDGDGDLDLVCGNSGANTLYRNNNGQLENTPVWSSGPANLTADVALGDVDGDGDLDLVCGNGAFPGEANALYLNLNGTFDTNPVWTSLPANITTAVALVDVNGDGRLDLVCGNSGTHNHIYLNTGGVFSSSYDWFSWPESATTGVASGDVEGDGDFDIAFSNSGEGNTSYENGVDDDVPMFEIVPSWESTPANTSSHVVMNDVDGDGYLDLVFGNVDQANTVYLGQESSFTHNPVWSSVATNRTSALALGDVDGDGDLDLACANLSQVNTVYINLTGESGTAGLYETSPVWSTTAAYETEDVEWCDFDGDGDFDLLFGNELTSNTAYKNTMNPAYAGTPSNPTGHLPNNTAFLLSVRAVVSAANRVQIHFTAVDVESDPVWVLPEYQFDGVPDWTIMDVGAVSGPAGPFVSSPGGTEDSLEWDITRVPFSTRDVTIRLKAIEVPASISFVQQVPSYLNTAGRISPTRPEIATTAGPVNFGTVTLGDTVYQDLAISNTGNQNLSINDFRLPSAEMRVDVSTPIVLPPGAGDTVRVYVEPLFETSLSGNIEIASNDPLTPTATVSFSTDIRELEVTTRLLTAAAEIPLGEAATVIVEPSADVAVEKGFLFHRAAGEVSFDSIPLSPIEGDEFVAVIPGAAIKETGLQYYVRVENTPVTRTDPPDAPVDSVYFQAVEQPERISSVTRPTFENDYLEGRSIKVDVTLPQGANFVSGILFYRKGADYFFDQADLTMSGNLPSAMIPAGLAGPRGVEYWVQVETSTSTLTDPFDSPQDNPLSVSITIPDLPEPALHAGGAYRLFSIPLKMRGGILGSVADELGGIDKTRWRLFAYDVPGSSYQELPDDSMSAFEQGRAYWLITRENNQIGTGPDRGDTSPTDDYFGIVLQPGHNLIGNPFNFPVRWELMMVDTLPVTDTLAAAVVEPPVRWIPGHGYSYDTAVLHPFDGYWIKNLSASPVELKIPPVEIIDGPALSEGVANNRQTKSTENEWTLRISASSGKVADPNSILGVAPGASNEWDRNDRSAPPLAPEHALSLYFPHGGWRVNAGRYARDIRSGELFESYSIAKHPRGLAWFFDVAKTFATEKGGDEIQLGFFGIDNIPDQNNVFLLDRRLDRSLDLRGYGGYEFYLGKKDFVDNEENARFALLVGDDEFISTQMHELRTPPQKTALYQNYPNPFNPSTIIRYQIARSGRVSLKIFDVNGALVKTLESRERKPGRYEVGWNGQNNRGEIVASGVYFCRLITREFNATRKMVLLK